MYTPKNKSIRVRSKMITIYTDKHIFQCETFEELHENIQRAIDRHDKVIAVYPDNDRLTQW